MLGIRVGDGDYLYFGYLDGDVGSGFVVCKQLVAHVARVVVTRVADVQNFGDYYDDCVLVRVS